MKNYLNIYTLLLFLITIFSVNFCQAYDNPIGHDSITSFLGGLLVSIQGIVGWLAIIFIVIGGIIYLTAGGKDSQITLAKNTIVSALIGFALAIAGPSLLKEIKDLISTAGTSVDIDASKSIYDILADSLNFVLTLVGILSLISLIYSGFTYLSSAGKPDSADKAKKIIVYSIIALAISGGSLILIKTIITFLSV